MGAYVRPWNPGLKSKESSHPKFYLFDPGTVRACAGLLNQELDSEYLGFMFETFILGQLRAYLNQMFKYFDIYHYSITGSYDIDFVIQTRKPVMSKRGEIVLIEVKYGKKFRPEWLKGSIDLMKLSKEKIKGSHIVYAGKDRLRVDGVEIWPANEFLKALFNSEITG
jgi:predicted AAA+ superfamily ATPase